MLPLARSETNLSRTPGRAKTPGKMDPPSSRYTGTIRKVPLGSANKFHSFTTPSSQKRITNNLLRRTDNIPRVELNYMDQSVPFGGFPKESLDNNTFSILNCSTSTEVEAPAVLQHKQLNATPQQAPATFSPLMRKMESMIEDKLTSFMENFKNQTSSAAQTSQEIRTSVRDAVMNGLDEASGFTATASDSETVSLGPLIAAQSNSFLFICSSTQQLNFTTLRTHRRAQRSSASR